MSRNATSSALVFAALLWPLICSAAMTHAADDGSDGVIRRYVIVHGDSMTGSWVDSDSPSRKHLRAQFGDRFAWFSKDGHEYVITASSVMDDLDRAMEPQKSVNRMQAGVNREQQRVNEMQATVNAHQRKVNAMQARVNDHQPDIDQERVNREQSEVNGEQAGVNGEQRKVNAMQEQVNQEQHRVSDELNRRVKEIFDSALRVGLAKKLR